MNILSENEYLCAPAPNMVGLPCPLWGFIPWLKPRFCNLLYLDAHLLLWSSEMTHAYFTRISAAKCFSAVLFNSHKSLPGLCLEGLIRHTMLLVYQKTGTTIPPRPDLQFSTLHPHLHRRHQHHNPQRHPHIQAHMTHAGC